MAAALTFVTDADTPVTHEIPGGVLQGFVLPPREFQQKITKFWGLWGESRINGLAGGRVLQIPLLVYDDEEYETQAELAAYVEGLKDLQGVGGTLTVHSPSSHPAFTDCVFDGLAVGPAGIQLDVAGSLGGGAFCEAVALFRQLK